MAEDVNLWREALGGAFLPGDVLVGKYRLDRIVGLGGMGVIVEARHLDLDEKVALKLLRPKRVASDKARARFAREARAGFKMTSEHVARVFDLGELDDGMQYMAMEYLQGHDFAQLLAERGHLPADTAVGFVLQVCEALAEAHALGIVHRDLKPENLFLCKRADGTPCVKVLDFGLAKLERRSQSLTRVNRGMGTPRYMAPEQWVSARDVGPPADIWALGVILYELVSGTSPFDDADIRKLSHAVIFAAAPRLSSRAPGVPPGLEVVVERCMQKKPAERYGNIAELAAELIPHAPQAPLGRLDDLVRGLPPATSNWALTRSETSVEAQPQWLEGTLESVHDENTNEPASDASDGKTEEPTTVYEQRDEPAVSVAAPQARADRRPASSRKSRFALLGVLAVALGALLAVATVRERAPIEEAPHIEAQRSDARAPVASREVAAPAPEPAKSAWQSASDEPRLETDPSVAATSSTPPVTQNVPRARGSQRAARRARVEPPVRSPPPTPPVAPPTPAPRPSLGEWMPSEP